MNKIDRYKILIRYCKENCIASSQKELGAKMGYQNESSFSQVINGKVEEPKDFIIRLKELVPGLSDIWINEGIGNMIANDATAQSSEEYNERNSGKGVLMVPVINIDARGGMLANQETDVAEYVVETIPFSNGIAQPGDFVIPMYGDSMYPRYPSGSRLLIRPVEGWREFLELGACYVIELNDGRRVVKIVKKGSDSEHFLLVSVNPEFEAQEIPLSIINHVYLVKLMLKNETV